MQPQELGPGNIWFPIAFVLIMMVAAALISAAADRMGHRAARRKLRIGKLRPRHVSTLIAIISGLLISLVTVGAMFLIWRDFYYALTQWDNLNGELARVRGQIEAAQAEAAEANKEADAARGALALAEQEIAGKSAEIQQKTREITATRSRLSGAQAEVQRSRGKLAELRGSAERVSRELARKQAELEQTQKLGEFYNEQQAAVREQIREQINQLEAELSTLQQEISRAQTGRTVMNVGQQLGYIHVRGGADGLEPALQAELARIKSDIESRGLEFDPQSREKVVDFLNAFPTNGEEYIVRIVSAENVFEGDRVLLDFSYEELRSIVSAGVAIIDISLRENSATISTLGGVRREISVPEQFDESSLIDFAVEVERAYQSGARAAGFVAGAQGEVASPVEKLTRVAGELISGQRPQRIQFVTQRSANALQGEVLASAQLHVTSLPRVQERRAPEPPQAAPEEEAVLDDSSEESDTPPAGDVPEEDGDAG